jgi:hypothetical protein
VADALQELKLRLLKERSVCSAAMNEIRYLLSYCEKISYGKYEHKYCFAFCQNMMVSSLGAATGLMAKVVSKWSLDTPNYQGNTGREIL